jgi:hypothetical protein
MRRRFARRPSDHSRYGPKRHDRIRPRARLFQNLATRKSKRADQTGDSSMNESRPLIYYSDPRPESKIGKVRTALMYQTPHSNVVGLLPPGNSSGPLLSDDGKIVGVNSFIRKDAEGKGVVSQIRPDFEWSSGPGDSHLAAVIQTQTPIIYVHDCPLGCPIAWTSAPTSISCEEICSGRKMWFGIERGRTSARSR